MKRINRYLHSYLTQVRAHKYIQPQWTEETGTLRFTSLKRSRPPSDAEIGPDIRTYLQRSNPFLADLKAKYASLGWFDQSFWIDQAKRIDLIKFRRDWNYLSQLESRTDLLKYLFTTEYVESIDKEGLLWKMHEDSLFGISTFKVSSDLLASRDLLDSIMEIYFLKKHLGWESDEKSVLLDIAAGYGRFAYRWVEAFPRSHIYCIDAVPESTFLCDFYLRFRNVALSAETLPLYDMGKTNGMRFDLACNIHSRSECTLQSVRFWLDSLADLRVEHLFVVPHEGDFLTDEKDGARLSFLPEMKRHGYKLVAQEEKYTSTRLGSHWGIYPAIYNLFRLRS